MVVFVCVLVDGVCFFFKQKTAYEMRISDWSSDVCSSDLAAKTIGMLQPSNVKLTQLERIFEMRTGKQYLESLRGGRKVYVGGEIIEDVTTHPMTKGYANAIAEYYDLHLKHENDEICTFIDDKGNRQSMHWFIPKSKEEIG